MKKSDTWDLNDLMFLNGEHQPSFTGLTIWLINTNPKMNSELMLIYDKKYIVSKSQMKTKSIGNETISIVNGEMVEPP